MGRILRVRVVVTKVIAHVRGKDLTVRLIVRKGKLTENLGNLYRIVNYECSCKAELEFYLSNTTPEFKILVLIVSEDRTTTKIFGEVSVALKESKPQDSDEEAEPIEAKLENCPDKNASLTYHLSIEEIDSDIPLAKALVSQKEFDQQYYLKEVNELREQLTTSEQAAKKSKELLEGQLRQQAANLEKAKQQLKRQSKEFAKEREQLQGQLETCKEECASFKEDLMHSKKKLADIVDVLNEEGDASLLERIEELMSA